MTRYDTKQFACRYARLPAGYALSSLSWGTGTCFFLASVRHTAQDPASPDRHRSGVLIYRFNHWHPAWHLDKLQPPHFLLHTGLRMPNYTLACTNRAVAAKRGAGGDELSDLERAVVAEAEGTGDVEWKDRFMICPENYPLSAGMLQPASSLGQQSPLIVVQAEVEPSGCRVFVVFAAAHHPPTAPRPTHVAAYAPRFTSLLPTRRLAPPLSFVISLAVRLVPALIFSNSLLAAAQVCAAVRHFQKRALVELCGLAIQRRQRLRARVLPGVGATGQQSRFLTRRGVRRRRQRQQECCAHHPVLSQVTPSHDTVCVEVVAWRLCDERCRTDMLQQHTTKIRHAGL